MTAVDRDAMLELAAELAEDFEDSASNAIHKLVAALEQAEDDSFRHRAAMVREQARADQAEARIADALALCSEWEAMGTRQMNIGAVRRALNGDA